MFGELAQGKRPKRRRQRGYKDICKRCLKALGSDLDEWEILISERSVWTQAVPKGLSGFEASLCQRTEVKRQRQRTQTQGDRPGPEGGMVRMVRPHPPSQPRGLWRSTLLLTNELLGLNSAH